MADTRPYTVTSSSGNDDDVVVISTQRKEGDLGDSDSDTEESIYKSDPVISTRIFAIVSILLFFPVGIPSLIFACKATDALEKDPSVSKKHIETSRTLAFIAAAIGVVLIVVLIIFVLYVPL
eukprot:TRINITY_DN8132_c0_g1_i1.p1 TRINITY_DN8132_c0_g1~~TRINITY_DN8132_c0_g1_i1.p1  ORF type:complete len:122 (+),score=22.46 TRINITY_DN8132_c0_g1_i1:65-430(+)